MKKVFVFRNKGYIPMFNPSFFTCVNCDLKLDLTHLNGAHCLLLANDIKCPLWNRCYVTLKELKGGL